LQLSSNFDPILIQFLNSLALNENLKIKVQTNSVFQPLTIIVMNGRGIAYSKNIPEPGTEKVIEISIPIIAQMAPLADVIVFYLREQDGSPVQDQLRINIGMKGDNFVSSFFPPGFNFSNHNFI
jgi:hypothetical protein